MKNKAFERAKAAYGTGAYDDATLEFIFPELKESEDESTRKALIETVKCIYAGDTMFLSEQQRDRYLDWLEKQKEQKPNIELIQRSWYMEGYHDREFGKEPKWIIKTGEGGPKHQLNPKYGQPLAKEQKPWKVGANAYFTPEQKPADLSEMMVHKEPYIAPVPTPMVADEQKPVDYEAELKKCKDNPLYFYDKYVSIKQKPAEWSEEDEKMLERAIHIIVEYSDIDEEESEIVQNWLKSLRPSWKPSENELAKKHLDGYCMGREDTLREMKDFVESHFTHREYKSPECGTCASAWNTSSGTSTATLHGNTSATDGKEHNPSFTD